ncbi:MAG: phosphatidylglycerol lysyltransferase domain-containing protein [Parabacteroides sp.]|nr:phosphatidylglycerol lysyltransferase domain-containing protein [Bacteroidaceae bacterium]
MIEFKDLTIKDKDIITGFTMNSNRINCDLSFSNLCSWRFKYDTKFAVVDDFLLLKFWVQGQLAYITPVGKGKLRNIMKVLTDDAKMEKQPFCMLGICSDMRNELQEAMSNNLVFSKARNYADYIYLHTNLATLKGKKLQSKRNFINRFRRNHPDYQYEPITPEHIEECIALEVEWCKVNHCDEREGVGNERRALVYALQHFKELGLTGSMIRIDGKIIAFTFGMPINQTTFGVHVEKADTEIEGSYAIINYEFVNHIPEKYIYINREEDLGIEGLRKAKLSYQPEIILDKYMACLKEEPLDFINW